MDKEEKLFYEVFTDLQCFILANMNKGDINGVTATHYNIIEYVYRHDQCTGKQIARAFNISAPAISRQLKFLIENGFIEQEQSAADRRIFNLSVADKGRFIIDNSENFRETVVQNASKTLTRTELKSLTSLLSKVIKNL
ncbi:MarR family winged helix-turn-helix transcriptional regulator [Pedobacter africanus]|uniref:DNA-binding transcriptional regulator, MarR family n=1 Tax=Pedobacter africanus TaxID=151894 RepID=A0A1W2CWV0_9SPHI|nr:MarR family transcriptional regulator [Pedobacter africanus]SMC89436.1 DNA-binding transcriptional regulator, MarR family [Pedobacter africanus]